MYQSGILAALSASDRTVNFMPESFYLKENFMGGVTISGRNGTAMLETTPSAAGGETVVFSNGETAHMSENIYGGTTLDFQGVSGDVVGMPSVFGGETFTQGGTYLGSTQPNFTGEGMDFFSATGEKLMGSSPDIFGGTQLTFHPSSLDYGSPFELHETFAGVDAITSQFSVADFGTAADALDLVDLLGIF